LVISFGGFGMLGGQISRMTKWGTYKIIETMLVFVQLILIFKKDI